MSSPVLIEVHKGVMTVTLNRPEAKNAVNLEIAKGVAEAMRRLDESDELRVAIITGAGGTFCSGMDLKGFLDGEIPVIEGRGFAGLTQGPPEKPLIAAVDGFALAGGMEIALACDMIVAQRDARFGIPEAKLGLVAGAGGLVRLPRQIPIRLAMEYALTGDLIDAKRAYEIGLINRITDGPALIAAKDLAATICANGPLAVRATKKVMTEQAGWPAETMWQRQDELIGPIFDSNDAREGAAAFAEKRKAKWTGT